MTLNTDLEALYHFTGNANDSSGNGNNGTVTGATLTTDKNGASNQAYDFDGSNDYISLVDFTYSGDFTISAWYYLDSTFNGDNPIIFDHGGTGRIVVFANGTSSRPFRWSVVGNSTSFDRNTGVQVETETWNMITIKREGNVFTLYKNGVQIDTVTSAVGTVNPTNVFYLGRFNGGVAALWKGKIDEVRVYSRALTEYEILQLYYGYDTEADSVNTLIEGQVSYYKMDGDVTDSHSTNDATNFGTTSVTGKINSARTFNGSSTYVRAPTNLITATGDFTINCWVKTTQTGGFKTIVSQSEGTSSGRWNFILDNNFLEWWDLSTGFVSSGQTINNGVWRMVSVTRNGTTAQMYVDGSPAGSSFTLSTSLATIETSFGANRNGFTWYNGDIDELGFWDRALLSDEISELYNSNNGLQYPYVTPTGYPNKVNGISPSKVNGISVANISKINNS